MEIREEQETQEGIKQPHYVSNYDANNAQIDMPMHSDLNKKQTCTDLLDYTIQLKTQLSEMECEEGWEEIPPLFKDIPMYLLGDGNPTFTMSKVIREESKKYKEEMQPYTGGFHCGLGGHRKRGYIFGISFLEDTFSCWRESEGQL